MIKITYELQINGKAVKISEDKARKLYDELHSHFGPKTSPLDDLFKRTTPQPFTPGPMYTPPVLIGDDTKWPPGTIIC